MEPPRPRNQTLSLRSNPPLAADILRDSSNSASLPARISRSLMVCPPAAGAPPDQKFPSSLMMFPRPPKDGVMAGIGPRPKPRPSAAAAGFWGAPAAPPAHWAGGL